MSYLEIISESSIGKMDNLYINFPIAILDFKDLFLDQCPHIEPTQLKQLRRQYIDEVNLTLFDFDKLRGKLYPLLKNECDFFQQVTGIIMKLLQDIRLTDSENQIVSLEMPFVQDFDKKVREAQVNLPKQYNIVQQQDDVMDSQP